MLFCLLIQCFGSTFTSGHLSPNFDAFIDFDVDNTPVIEICITCKKPFHTYAPTSNCHLPGGAIVTYNEPQLECPLCDKNG